jgi:hypothetical protein
MLTEPASQQLLYPAAFLAMVRRQEGKLRILSVAAHPDADEKLRADVPEHMGQHPESSLFGVPYAVTAGLPRGMVKVWRRRV